MSDDCSGLTVPGVGHKEWQLMLDLLKVAEALPKGDRDREKLLRVAHDASYFAEIMAARERGAWELAAMDAAEAGAEPPAPPEPLPDLAPELIPLLREGAALSEKAFSSQDSIAELMKPLDLPPATAKLVDGAQSVTPPSLLCTQ